MLTGQLHFPVTESLKLRRQDCSASDTHCFTQFSLDDSRSNSIDTNVLWGARFCHCLTEAKQGRLADAVCTYHLQIQQKLHTSDISVRKIIRNFNVNWVWRYGWQLWLTISVPISVVTDNLNYSWISVLRKISIPKITITINCNSFNYECQLYHRLHKTTMTNLLCKWGQAS